ncbi:MAG: ArsB/NhaD family transporter [Thermomicrobiales bacterium]
MQWLVVGVTLLTLGAIVARPRGLGEAWAAATGGAAMLLLGAVVPADLLAIGRETSDVLLFLLGMMVLTWLVEQAGVFDWLADRVAALAGGSGPRLFALVFALAAVVTALLSLDVTVLILTPIVYALTTRRRLDALPFMFACTFVANTGSLILPISNLTNLLVYSGLRLDFGAFAARMWLPNLVALLVNFAVFRWLFRGSLPARFAAATDDLPLVDWWFRSAALILAATLMVLLVAGLVHSSLAWPALAGGGLLLLIGLLGRRVGFGATARSVSWPLFVFVIGMFILVRGFEHFWLEQLAFHLPTSPLPALLLAVGANAIGSNIVNNVPMTLLSLPFIAHAGAGVQEPLAYGTLVGTNIGPTLTTYGSLATMLWLTLIRKRGLDVTTGAYLRVALVTTPIVLVATTLTLWVMLR